MEGLWERFDLVCDVAPDGCDPMETALRWIIWGLLILGFLISYFAIRGWTVDLNKYVGMVIAAGGGYLITSMMRGYVAGDGSLRTTVIVAGILLAIAGVGRPQILRDLFDQTRAKSKADPSAAGAAEAPAEHLN